MRALMSFDHGSASLTGHRPQNEDSVLELPDWGVFAVCDGMGGHSGGAEASRIVVDSIADAFHSARHRAANFELNDVIHRITVAAIDASHLIRDWAARHHVHAMGSTLAAIITPEESSPHGACLHAGDSLAYRLRGDEIMRVYQPHNLESVLGQAAHDLPIRQRRAITRAVDHRADVNLEMTPLDFKSEDAWMLCTDGITEALDIHALGRMLHEHRAHGARVAAQEIAREALHAGSKDNATALVLYVK